MSQHDDDHKAFMERRATEERQRQARAPELASKCAVPQEHEREYVEPVKRASKPKINPYTEPMSILDEAQLIIHGPRRVDYGTPEENHGRTAAYWSIFLRDKDVECLTSTDVCFLNILQKIARCQNKVTRDNVVDIAGYAGNIDILEWQEKPIEDRDLGDVANRLASKLKIDKEGRLGVDLTRWSTSARDTYVSGELD